MENNKPKISIIIPVYNVVKYLTECVESVVTQEYDDYEIILVDDGSTDGSDKMCDELAEKYSKIQVIHKENGGLISARKAGILKAAGEYVLYIDSDDYIDKDLLKSIAEKINIYNPDVIAFDFARVDESGNYIDKVENKVNEGFYSKEKLLEIKEKLLYDRTEKELNTGKIICSVSKVFKKDCVFENQMAVPNEISHGEDIAVTMPTICNCKSLYVLKCVGYYYRQVSTSIMHTFDKDELKKTEILIKHLEENAKCINKKNINLFAYFIVITYLSKAMQVSNSLSDFKKIILENNCEPVVKTAKKVEYKYFSLKEKIRLFCLRHNFCLAFWIIHRIKK